MIGQIVNCFQTPIKVRRTNQATTFVGGLAQVNTETDEFCVNEASVQPMTGRERQLLPENIRDREVVKIYTPCELRGVDMDNKIRADRVIYKNREYVVQTVEDWNEHGGFWKSLAVKVNA